MYGAVARRSGTAWRCMLAPMSARLASSCSRNGISAVATDTSCFGDTSMYWTSSGAKKPISPRPARTSTRSSRKRALLVDVRVRLRDDVLVLVVGREVLDLVGDAALLDLAVRRLDEAEPVDAREARQVADEADVRAFRRLDRAHAAVVARVHVSHLEPGALTRQTTRAERREAALVREARERVRLVHELRQLRGAEELLDRRDHRTDVDQRLRRDRLDVLGRHALAHDALHAAEADAELVLDQLADGAHPAVAEVVDVVGEVAGVAVVQLHDVRDGREDVGLGSA